MLLLQLEKGTEESGPGPSRLQIQNSEGYINYMNKFLMNTLGEGCLFRRQPRAREQAVGRACVKNWW